MRFNQGEFDVTYAPGQSSPAKMIAAVQGVRKRYKASLKSAVTASVSDANVKVAAVTDKAGYKAGSKAKIKLMLGAKGKAKVSNAKVSLAVSEPLEGKMEKAIKGKLKKSKSVVIPVKVSKGAATGEYQARVTITYEGDSKSSVTILVPIYVQ